MSDAINPYTASQFSSGSTTDYGAKYGGGGAGGGSGAGPPSWVDTGDGNDDGGSESLTYYEEKFGSGGGDSGAQQLDPSIFLPHYTDTDKALAWVRLVLAFVFIVLGTFALVKFHRSRWILDIRTRSSRLVVIGGATIVVSYLVSINESLAVIWGPDYSLRWFWSSLVLFFITPNLFGSYICRALRLAVVFHPRAKRALPWLIPERNYVRFLPVMGLCFLGIPIYQEYTLEIWEVIPEQTNILATLSLVFGGTLACIYPFIRKVDDLFNISTELAVVSVLLIFLAISQKCLRQFGGKMEIRWIGNNLFFFTAVAVFIVSVVDPLRRLAFDPLAASKRNYADRVLLSRREGRSTGRTVSSGTSSVRHADSEDEEAAERAQEGRAPRSTTMNGEATGGNQLYSAGLYSAQRRPATAVQVSHDQEVWDFERLASTPLLAAAFDSYSRKALCHESVLFLSEVSRYQSGDYSEPSGGFGPSQFDAVCRIADTFIKEGAREEVNISADDKRRILNWVHKGAAWFEQEDDDERRLLFGRAYAEVKNMLEANLLRRFLQTDEFKSVRAQRENVTTMMISPPKQRGVEWVEVQSSK